MEDPWTELTKNLNTKEDWANLESNQWDELINMQQLQENQIDSMFEDFFKQQEAMFGAVLPVEQF